MKCKDLLFVSFQLLAATSPASLSGVIAAQVAATVQQAPALPAPQQQPTFGFVDATLPPAHRRLLELAFEATVGMPDFPHIDNRTRMQEEVALACIAAGQHKLAETLAARISNWRRGVIHAELAVKAAEKGTDKLAQRQLQFANSAMASLTTDEDAQAWQRDRIRARLALAYRRLGDDDKAATLAAELDASQAREWSLEQALDAPAADFEAQIKAFEQVLESGNLDDVLNVTRIFRALYLRHYADEARRLRIEGVVKGALQKMPPLASFTNTLEFIAIAAEGGDGKGAREWLGDVSSKVMAARWYQEDLMEMRARIARTWFVIGDRSRAAAELDETLADFENARDKMQSNFRADGLVPVAEAWHVLGNDANALAIYRRALTECVENGNSRPRLEDLVMTCLSIVKVGFEPDEALLEQAAAVRKGLGEPW
ncbi:MAG: hypothetical protein KDC98_15400 [Planctomycetes bacterium]|nr:hypothetical protein [Planctomycetota bacterium]